MVNPTRLRFWYWFNGITMLTSKIESKFYYFINLYMHTRIYKKINCRYYDSIIITSILDITMLSVTPFKIFRNLIYICSISKEKKCRCYNSNNLLMMFAEISADSTNRGRSLRIYKQHITNRFGGSYVVPFVFRPIQYGLLVQLLPSPKAIWLGWSHAKRSVSRKIIKG